MVSMLVLLYLFILIIPLLLVVRLKYDKRITSITLGSLMIEFSKIDKICYSVSLICLVAGIVLGISMIWIEDINEIAAKVVGSLGLIFVLCIGVLFLNKLIRSAGRYREY